MKTNVKQGYILAKAVRCAVYEDLNIQSSTNIDDLITSFMLKSFILTDFQGKLNDLQPCDVAIRIYQLLAENIHEKYMITLGETVFSCRACDGKQGCCKKLKFIMGVRKGGRGGGRPPPPGISNKVYLGWTFTAKSH